MATKFKISPVKASESVVARMAAKTLGVPAFDFVSEVIDAARDEFTSSQLGFLSRDVVFYEWTADVPAQIMSDKIEHLAEHVFMHEPGVVFMVKDSVRPGASGLWLVSSGEPHNSERCRGMFNHFMIDDKWVKITAIQLETCTRQP